MSKAASKAALEELHAALAEQFKTVIKTEPTAAVLSAAAKFLKDNHIEAAPGSPAMEELKDALEEQLPFSSPQAPH